MIRPGACTPRGGAASLRSLEPNAARVFGDFVRFLEKSGLKVRITSTRRDPSEQLRLWRCYQAGLSRFPAAPPGHSTHALGIAVDLVLNPPAYAWAGDRWERAGFTWGGRFRDPIHFDLRRRAA